MKSLVLSLLLLLPAPLYAAPDAMVEGVQMPAWIERNGVQQPLVAGTALKDGDQLRTGGNARVWLKLGEGSVVKLGENGQFMLESAAQSQADGNLFFSAAMRVMRGAFRFTTRALYKLRGERDIRVKFSAITAGIRGTDLWGKSTDEKDVLCLIEGGINVVRDNGEVFVMKDPMSFYVVPKNAPPQPVAPVPPEQLKKWALETEILPGQGAARRGGRWKVYLLAADTQAEALAAYDLLRANGYPAEISPLAKEGGWTYRVRINQLPSKQEAQALAIRLKGQMGIVEPAVSAQ